MADMLLHDRAVWEVKQLMSEFGPQDLAGVEALAVLAILRGAKERIDAQQRPPGRYWNSSDLSERRAIIGIDKCEGKSMRSILAAVGVLLARSGQSSTAEPSARPLTPLAAADNTAADQQIQKFQSSSSVLTALPITYDEPEPEKKSWFSSALGDNADRMAGLTSVSSRGNSAS
jgi:hypothetical protein